MDATVPLDEIASFVRVVQAGSFTAAAKQLGVPKSTLSRALRRLEDAASVRLLERSTRSISVTDAGRAFYEQVAPHVAGLHDATAALGDLVSQPQGLLRITAPVDVGESFLGELLVRFAARYPNVRLEVDLSSRVVNLLEEGFDAALRATTRLADAALVARRLVTTEIHLFAAPSYLARRAAPRVPEDLAAHTMVLFRGGKSKNALTLRGPEGASRTVSVEGRIGGNDFPFVRAALRGGAGIGPLPSFLATADVLAGRLVRVLPAWVQPGGSLYVVYPSAPHVPKKVLAFRDFMVEACRSGELDLR